MVTNIKKRKSPTDCGWRANVIRIQRYISKIFKVLVLEFAGNLSYNVDEQELLYDT